jgi:signal transduction histidine kinase
MLVASDKAWPRLVSLAVHELRTPATVIGGYLRLLLKDRAGPLSDDQRRLVEEAEKSCGRIAVLLAELSDLAHLDLGDAPIQHQTIDLAAVLREVVDEAAVGTDIPAVTFRDEGGRASFDGDAARLKAAFAAVVRSIQRELPMERGIVVRRLSQSASTIVTVSTAEMADAVAQASDERFDELRGGMGLALPLARHVIHEHGGRLAILSDRPRTGVAVIFPTE